MAISIGFDIFCYTLNEMFSRNVVRMGRAASVFESLPAHEHSRTQWHRHALLTLIRLCWIWKFNYIHIRRLSHMKKRSNNYTPAREKEKCREQNSLNLIQLFPPCEPNVKRKYTDVIGTWSPTWCLYNSSNYCNDVLPWSDIPGI